MSLIIWFGLISVVIELALFFIHKLWIARQWIAIGLVILISLSASGLIFLKPNLFTGLLLIASVSRLFNVLRIVENRINEKHLYQAAKKTSFGLIGWEIIILLAWFIVYKLSIRNTDLHNIIIGLLWSLALAAFIVSLSTLRNLKKTKPKLPLKNINDHDLPTVSVCIPARNETDDLTEILQTIIASNYPKLEILVLYPKEIGFRFLGLCV